MSATATVSTAYVLDRIATLLVDRGLTTEARDMMTDVRDHSEGITEAQADAITAWRRSITELQYGWIADGEDNRTPGDPEALRQAEAAAREAALGAFAPHADSL